MRALVIYAISFSIRVIRNTLVTIFWSPCFTVYSLLTTSLINVFFYILTDFIPIFFILRIHYKNYSYQHPVMQEGENIEVSTTMQNNSATDLVSGASSPASINSDKHSGFEALFN
jgi:hypothetical protein